MITVGDFYSFCEGGRWRIRYNRASLQQCEVDVLLTSKYAKSTQAMVWRIHYRSAPLYFEQT